MRREIRPATTADVDRLQAIESAADARFEDLFGPEPFGAEAAEPGEARTATPGFVLVAAERPAGPAVGFVHVLEVETVAHLEQLAVVPEQARRGHGGALVEAACAEAARRGYRSITLRTFADVPFNAPFYAAHGFVETPARDAPFFRALEATEAQLGLDRLGRRVLMVRELSPHSDVRS
ncbi:GNAT family N-acetyltransferase [Brachybacterium huguangmaarense]|uniref:GNAT family N-acetyltransferase n=1 Tax=Brachybacterium huguangmaarense TaxID=1652028 RepID=A0ABY6FYJ9_9MICO|nr:GNAT family N-acetyltransferase [Brachybacterium huguangmaarense]UYG16008.1 GNAT family N-acetyltransferase [Brachybacterium huguangmaarense]